MISSLRAEVIKTKRLRLLPLALCVGAGLAALVLAILRSTLERVAHERRAEAPWQNGVVGDSAIFAILAFPTLVVLVTALVFYIEHRDSMWKQLRATPQHLATIYASKFVLIQAIVATALLTALAVGLVGWSLQPEQMRNLLPATDSEVRQRLARVASELYVALLPVAVIQFALSSRLPNVLHSVGIGLCLTIGSLLLYGPGTARYFPYAYPGAVVINRFGGEAISSETAQAPDLAYHAAPRAFGAGTRSGGVILVDASHGNRHTADDTSTAGTLRWIVAPAAEVGIDVRHLRTSWTPSALGEARLLVVAGVAVREDVRPIAPTEVQAVVEWVRRGGSLLVLTDHDPYAEPLEPLARELGVGLSLGIVNDPAHGDDRDPRSNRIVFTRQNGLLASHPVTEGVRAVISYGGQAVWRLAPGTSELLRLAPTARNLAAPAALTDVPVAHRAQLLAFAFGAGRVVFSGETALFTAQVKPDGASFGVADPLVDNGKLAANAFRWLLE
jgi:hypothetical protein